MKRGYLNIVLAVVLLGLGAAIYFKHQSAKKTKPPLTTLARDKIDRIVITHPKAKDVVLHKSGKQWTIVQPVTVPADHYEVNSVLDLASLKRQETMSTKGLKLSELGLDPPQYTVKLNDTLIKVGNVEPLRYRRYMQVGDQVALVENPPQEALGSDYADLVSKHLLPKGARIEKIQLPDLTLTRSEDGKGWQLMPADPKAPAAALQELIDNWKNATSMWNKLAPADAKPPKDAQYADVTLKSGANLRFLIAKHDPQLILQRDDIHVRYALGKDWGDKLLELPPQPKPKASAGAKADKTDAAKVGTKAASDAAAASK